MTRAFRLLMYGLILASAAAQFALVPVMPVYAHRFGLSGLQQGLLLGATGLATLAVSVPADTAAPTGSAPGGYAGRGSADGGRDAWAGPGGQLPGSARRPARVRGRLRRAVDRRAVLAGRRRGRAAGPGRVGVQRGVGGVVGPAVSGALTEHLGLAVPLLAAAAGFAVDHRRARRAPGPGGYRRSPGRLPRPGCGRRAGTAASSAPPPRW